MKKRGKEDVMKLAAHMQNTAARVNDTGSLVLRWAHCSQDCKNLTYDVAAELLRRPPKVLRDAILENQ